MKKAIAIIVFGLLWCNVGVAECIEGNCIDGQGTFTYADGGKYIGEWENNKRHGKGTYLHANGDKYIGEHKDDKMHGQGTHTWSDGTVSKGIWENNELIEQQ